MRLAFALLCHVLSLTFISATIAGLGPDVTATSLPPQSTKCGDIVNSCNATFTAKQAYDCLNSVPFDPAVATNFIQYYNDTIQFHSTLAYLKNPPSSYQQPAVDIEAGLQRIQDEINNGTFPNQYSFEATLQNLVYSAHDAHLQLQSGILDVFTFMSPYSLVSLSDDGVQIPKVYVVDDISLQLSDIDFTPSAIKTINGQDVTAYLTQIAAVNSAGNIEPNADWNDLMTSWAAYIQDDYSTLEAYVEFFPGETIALGFENGTDLKPLPWQAVYNSPGPTGPLATGGDFYNFFVLGFYPASYDPNAPDPCASSVNSSDSSTTATISVVATAASTSLSSIISSSDGATVTSFPNSAYPNNTDVFQPNLYPSGGGFVTGYFLTNISTAVLSIPTFNMEGGDIQTFSDTIQNFLDTAHNAGLSKVLIDLQQNLGGETLLAVDTFKRFFPSNDTFRGSRLRAQPFANVIGNTFTQFYQDQRSQNSSVYDDLSASDFVATSRIDVETNQNFTSWAQFFGPHPFNDDLFTTVQRENISDSLFDNETLGIQITGASVPATSGQLYDPENIILLTDGLCSSACAVFVEMMHHEAGVKAVTVGGRPSLGPMQIASGTRGAQIYLAQNIDDDISVAEYFNATTNSSLPDREVDTWIDFLSVNLRDQIRREDFETDGTPVQFLYDAADCRIFYTADTLSDYSKLWRYAVRASDDPSSLCVQGSTGFSYTKVAGSAASSPPPTSQTSVYNASLTSGTTNQFTNFLPSDLELDDYFPASVKGGSVRVRPVNQACNNHGNGCSFGRCQLTTDEHRVEEFNGRQVHYYSGTCPTNSVASSGFVGLSTKVDEPAEYHRRWRDVEGAPSLRRSFGAFRGK
ncbi:hypothetical protein BDR22DRAFT_857304 [Usnea florida]